MVWPLEHESRECPAMLAWVIEHTSRKTSVIVTNTLRVDGFRTGSMCMLAAPTTSGSERTPSSLRGHSGATHFCTSLACQASSLKPRRGRVLRLHDMPAELEWLHGHILNQGDVNARFEYHQDTGEERSRISGRRDRRVLHRHHQAEPRRLHVDAGLWSARSVLSLTERYWRHVSIRGAPLHCKGRTGHLEVRDVLWRLLLKHPPPKLRGGVCVCVCALTNHHATPPRARAHTHHLPLRHHHSLTISHWCSTSLIGGATARAPRRTPPAEPPPDRPPRVPARRGAHARVAQSSRVAPAMQVVTDLLPSSTHTRCGGEATASALELGVLGTTAIPPASRAHSTYARHAAHSAHGRLFCCLLLLLGDGPELTRNESGTFDIASLHGELQLQLEDGLAPRSSRARASRSAVGRWLSCHLKPLVPEGCAAVQNAGVQRWDLSPTLHGGRVLRSDDTTRAVSLAPIRADAMSRARTHRWCRRRIPLAAIPGACGGVP